MIPPFSSKYIFTHCGSTGHSGVFYPVTNQPFGKGRQNQETWKHKKKKKWTPELADEKKTNKKVCIPVKEQYIHQKVYSFTVGQQRLQMQYA